MRLAPDAKASRRDAALAALTAQAIAAMQRGETSTAECLDTIERAVAQWKEAGGNMEVSE